METSEEENIRNALAKQKQDFEKMIDELIVRSGYEMMIARAFSDDKYRLGFHKGAKEMEEIWHKILKELKSKLKGELK